MRTGRSVLGDGMRAECRIFSVLVKSTVFFGCSPVATSEEGIRRSLKRKWKSRPWSSKICASVSVSISVPCINSDISHPFTLSLRDAFTLFNHLLVHIRAEHLLSEDLGELTNLFICPHNKGCSNPR